MATNLEQENRRLREYLFEVKQAAARCEAENDKLRDDIRVMVEKAAEEHLPAYREQGEKMLKVVQQNECMKEYLQSRGHATPGMSHWDNFVMLNPEYNS